MGWVGLGGNKLVESVTCKTTTCRLEKMLSKGGRAVAGLQGEPEKNACVSKPVSFTSIVPTA